MILESKKIKVCHCFHFFPTYLPWSDGIVFHDLIFQCWVLSQLFHSPFSPSSRGSSSLSAIKVVSSAYLRLLVFLLAILTPACDSSSLAFHMKWAQEVSRIKDQTCQLDYACWCLGGPGSLLNYREGSCLCWEIQTSLSFSLKKTKVIWDSWFASDKHKEESQSSKAGGKECMLSCFSHGWLFVILTVACQGLLSMGFSRQEYWSRLPCPPPGDLPHSETEPASLLSPSLAGGFFTTSTTWET